MTDKINNTPSARIAGLIPAENHGSYMDPVVRQAKRAAGMKYSVQTWDEEEANQRKYNKEGKFKVGQYVFLPRPVKYLGRKQLIKESAVDRGQPCRIREIRANTSPPLIYVEKLDNSKIDRSFYPDELEIFNPMRKKDGWQAEKIVKKRKYRGVQQVKVRWLGQPAYKDSVVYLKLYI